MNEQEEFVYRYDVIERKWKPDFTQEVPEPNWVFQSQVAHVSEVVQYLVEQYVYEQTKQDVIEYEGVEFQ